MTREQALSKLQWGGALPELAEAIGIVVTDPNSLMGEIMLGLDHAGFVAEQAAIALYERTRQTLPEDRDLIETDPGYWKSIADPTKKALPFNEVSPRPAHVKSTNL